MNTSTNWTSAIAVLAAGLILGLLLMVVMRRRAKTESKPRPVLKGFVWGVATTLVLGFIGLRVAQAFQPAPKSEDVESRIARAKDLFAKDDLKGVLEQTTAVLAKHPDEPRALTYNAIALMSMGKLDEARTQLETATKKDPALLDAWVALASARAQAGDHDAAAAAIDSAIKTHPNDAPRLQQVLAQMQQSASNLPPDHPPLASASASAAAPVDGKLVHVTLALEDPSKSGIVYVIARADGAKGHPVAVKRIDTNAFPLTFDFGGADTMMGGALPAHFHLEARLDSDGDAGTNNASDPKASAEVSAGENVSLTLK
ncbi:MAG: hypothetical protein DMF56_01530 [Acidobacteria bacterium]|nr:MAG: hypothetical protein DMF56_01530 [Acidobacteriota bacterium]